MKVQSHKLWISGQWVETQKKIQIESPFSEEVVAEYSLAGPAEVEKSLVAAADGFQKFRTSSRSLRSRLLQAMSHAIETRRSEFVYLIVTQAAKPRAMAELEVSRAVGTFAAAAEEAKRYGGEIVPIDIDSSGKNFLPAQTFWQPRGPILGISPFNFPLNLVAHKVAPALAIGASILLKPPAQAPGAACLLAEVFEKAAFEVSDAYEKVPLSAFQVIHATNETFGPAIQDPRMSILSFTGSDKAGWFLRDQAKKKKVLLELGGNAAVIVHSDAPLKHAAQRIAFGGFAYSGQICISVQRVLVHESLAELFQRYLLAEVGSLVIGDPMQSETIIGPLIDRIAVDRILSWIEEAKQEGAKVLCGGNTNGNVLEPTVVSDVKASSKLKTQEVFGPVVVLDRYSNFEEALQKVNNSHYGLQAGIFTDSLKIVQEAVEKIEVGGLVINDVPTFRADHLPYGGVKDSGMGREGVKYAMEEFSERKTIVYAK